MPRLRRPLPVGAERLPRWDRQRRGYIRFMLRHAEAIPENVAYLGQLKHTARGMSASQVTLLWIQRMLAQFRQLAPDSLARAKQAGLINDHTILRFMYEEGRLLGLEYVPGSQAAFVMDAMLKALGTGAPDPPLHSQGEELADMFAGVFSEAMAASSGDE